MANDEQAIPGNANSLAMTLVEEEADSSIRRMLHDGRMFFSVVDVIGVLTDSNSPSVYWSTLKKRLADEGATQVFTNCERLRMPSPRDGKFYKTDTADVETLLRIIQSVPSPKAEPVKQWLAKVGAQRLEQTIRPLPAESASTQIATLTKPDEAAPALSWAEYYEALAALYRRQAVHEAQMRIVESRLDEHDDEIGELHDRVESVEELTRLVPEILERLGPETLTPAHQRWVQGAVKRLHDLSGATFPTIYTELGEAFRIAKYSDIREYDWPQVEAWFNQKIAAASK